MNDKTKSILLRFVRVACYGAVAALIPVVTEYLGANLDVNSAYYVLATAVLVAMDKWVRYSKE